MMVVEAARLETTTRSLVQPWTQTAESARTCRVSPQRAGREEAQDGEGTET